MLGEWIFMCDAWAFVGCNFIFVITVLSWFGVVARICRKREESNFRIFGF